MIPIEQFLTSKNPRIRNIFRNLIDLNISYKGTPLKLMVETLSGDEQSIAQFFRIKPQFPLFQLCFVFFREENKITWECKEAQKICANLAHEAYPCAADPQYVTVSGGLFQTEENVLTFLFHLPNVFQEVEGLVFKR